MVEIIWEYVIYVKQRLASHLTDGAETGDGLPEESLVSILITYLSFSTYITKEQPNKIFLYIAQSQVHIAQSKEVRTTFGHYIFGYGCFERRKVGSHFVINVN